VVVSLGPEQHRECGSVNELNSRQIDNALARLSHDVVKRAAQGFCAGGINLPANYEPKGPATTAIFDRKGEARHTLTVSRLGYIASPGSGYVRGRTAGRVPSLAGNHEQQP